MSWSKRRKRFNKTFDVLKHHRYLINLATTELIRASIAAKLDYHVLYGYPPFNKEIVKGMLNMLYGTALRGKHELV